MNLQLATVGFFAYTPFNAKLETPVDPTATTPLRIKACVNPIN